MSLTLYRRHKQACKAKDQGRAFRRCHCPIWVEGTLEGAFLRQTTKTTNFDRAEELVRDAVRAGRWGSPAAAPGATSEINVAVAVFRWLEDAKDRHLSRSSLKKMDLLGRQLTAFAKTYGLLGFESWNVDMAREFRKSWNDSAISSAKKLERLRGFFRFCVDSGWMKANPALALKPPKIEDPPTMPFEASEMARIYAAIDARAKKEGHGNFTDHLDRMRPLVMLMEHTGLRVGDAVGLEKSRVKDGCVFLYTAKTNVAVRIPVAPYVLAQLEDMTLYQDRWFFWTGEGSIETATGNYRRSLRKICEKAGIENVHPHRFRDTFAVSLLEKGVSLETLSKLLGHRSLKVTEKHYAPWVKGLQDRLEEAVKKTWATMEVVRKVG